MAATAAFNSPKRAGEKISRVVPSGLTFYIGIMVAIDALGAIVRAANTAGHKVLGKACNDCTETEMVVIDREPSWWKNSATSALTAAHVGKVCFIEDDTIVALTTTNKAKAGIVLDVETIDGVSMVLVDPRPILPIIEDDLVIVSADGAIPIIDGTVVLTKGTAGAQTLAAPTAAQQGTRLTITSGSNAGHVITATGLLEDGVTGGAKNAATMAAFKGATIKLIAHALKWNVESLNATTVA
jgi:hypothetical protein